MEWGVSGDALQWGLWGACYRHGSNLGGIGLRWETWAGRSMIYVWVWNCMYLCVCVCIYVCVCMSVYEWMNMCACVWMQWSLCKCVWKCVHCFCECAWKYCVGVSVYECGWIWCQSVYDFVCAWVHVFGVRVRICIYRTCLYELAFVWYVWA